MLSYERAGENKKGAVDERAGPATDPVDPGACPAGEIATTKTTNGAEALAIAPPRVRPGSLTGVAHERYGSVPGVGRGPSPVVPWKDPVPAPPGREVPRAGLGRSSKCVAAGLLKVAGDGSRVSLTTSTERGLAQETYINRTWG